MSLRTSSERLASQLSQVAGENAVLREPISKVRDRLIDVLATY